MRELEKILEEIEKARNCASINGDFNVAAAHEEDMNIIHKHMNDGWISVEERLPEDGTYLCTFKGELCGIEEPFTGMCGIENGVWDEPSYVTAWRPLPEPYRPEGSDGE